MSFNEDQRSPKLQLRLSPGEKKKKRHLIEWCLPSRDHGKFTQAFDYETDGQKSKPLPNTWEN